MRIVYGMCRLMSASHSANSVWWKIKHILITCYTYTVQTVHTVFHQTYEACITWSYLNMEIVAVYILFTSKSRTKERWSRKAVAAYLKSNQLLPFVFVQQQWYSPLFHRDVFHPLIACCHNLSNCIFQKNLKPQGLIGIMCTTPS